MNSPYISVIIPMYNSRDTIIACVQSVVNELNSVCCSWEIIAIDDGSTDDTVALLEKYIFNSNLESLRILCQKNSGAGAARNTGLKAAKGCFVAFNDSDDVWLSGKLKAQLEFFNLHPDAIMVGGLHEMNLFSDLWNGGVEFVEVSIKSLIYRSYFSTPTVIIKRDILTTSGYFHPTRRNAEEGFFFYKVVFSGRCFLMNKVVTRNFFGKKPWGESGLSGQIHKQSIGELCNIFDIYKLSIISINDFILSFTYSCLKYVRRILIYYFANVKRILLRYM